MDLSDQLDIASTGVTLILALLTYMMVREAKATALAAHKQALASQAQAEASSAQAALSLRAYLDARSPHVVAYPGFSSWPPYSTDTRQSGATRYEMDFEFDLRSANSQQLAFRFDILLRNESTVSALIWGIPDPVFLSPGDGWTADLVSTNGLDGHHELETLMAPIALGSGSWALPGGRQAILRCAVSGSVADWIDRILRAREAGEGPVGGSVEVIVGSQFDSRAVDNIVVRLVGAPLVEMQGSQERWELNSADSFAGSSPMKVVVDPVVRRHFASSSAELPQIV